MALNVHDMHLSDALEGMQRTGAAASGAQQQARQQAAQQQTYAQAAAEPAPRLAFYMGGRLLQPSSTVFQAVQAAVAADGRADMSSRLWGELHTLSYRLWGSAMRLQEAEAAASTMVAGSGATGASATDMEVGSPRSACSSVADISASPLSELLTAAQPQAMADLAGASEATRALLATLRSLEALNRLAPQLWAWLEGRAGAARPTSAPLPGHVRRDAFVSAKLGTKLGQQLKDVLAICGGALPRWAGALVAGTKFLFPFETRRRFFYCTSFGLARALHYLQQVRACLEGLRGQ